jgi:hypothetical protein
VLVVSVCLLILLTGAGVLRSKSVRAARSREAQELGMKLPGRITSSSVRRG